MAGVIDRIPPISICWREEGSDLEGHIGWSRNKVSEVNNFFPGDIQQDCIRVDLSSNMVS